MLLYIDALLQPRRQPSEPIGAGWNQIVITWASRGGTGMQACLALDARPRMLQQDRASERGTGRFAIWAAGELRLTAPAYKPLGGKLLELPARGHCGALFDPPDGRSIRLHLAAALLGLYLRARFGAGAGGKNLWRVVFSAYVGDRRAVHTVAYSRAQHLRDSRATPWGNKSESASNPGFSLDVDGCVRVMEWPSEVVLNKERCACASASSAGMRPSITALKDGLAFQTPHPTVRDVLISRRTPASALSVPEMSGDATARTIRGTV